MTPFIFDDLKLDEGLRLKAYQDTQGIWTVGYGHAHVPANTVWTQAQADKALAEDVAHAALLCDQYTPFWKTMDDVRQDVVLMMMFNMGWGYGVSGLSTFRNTLAHMKAKEYDQAAEGMLASKWAQQVGKRADRLATQMRTGVRRSHV